MVGVSKWGWVGRRREGQGWDIHRHDTTHTGTHGEGNTKDITLFISMLSGTVPGKAQGGGPAAMPVMVLSTHLHIRCVQARKVVCILEKEGKEGCVCGEKVWCVCVRKGKWW